MCIYQKPNKYPQRNIYFEPVFNDKTAVIPKHLISVAALLTGGQKAKML